MRVRSCALHILRASAGVAVFAWSLVTAVAGYPDLTSIEPDLAVPPCLAAEPKAGQRVFHRLKSWTSPEVYHCLYLPLDWKPESRYPILVEWGGNRYRSPSGDESTGKPEDTCLGYGLSGGKSFIWLSIPFLNSEGNQIATTWWGEPPTYDAKASLAYCQDALEDAFSHFGGDPQKVILCGFSRGAIACNTLGLQDENTASHWRAMFVYSHYDGIRRWPFPNSIGQPAIDRLKRLGTRPQFICDENLDQLQQTQAYVSLHHPQANVVYKPTGFSNHSDRWILRPSEARTEARAWLEAIIRN